MGFNEDLRHAYGKGSNMNRGDVQDNHIIATQWELWGKGI